MILETTRFGPLDVSEEQLITLPRGILGFPRQQRYALLARAEQEPLVWLQSADRPDLAFVLLDPRQFISGYQPVVTPEELKLLGAEHTSEIQCLALVTVGSDPEKMSANLLAPIVLCERTRRGLQAVQTSGDWSIQYPVIEGMRRLAGGPERKVAAAE